MNKLAIFMADGCEEIEGLTVVDLLRRAAIPVDMIAIGAETRVVGSHGIAFEADITADTADWSSYGGVILPGGMPGTTRLKESEVVRKTVKDFDAQGKLVAAICAAPTVLADCGILTGHRATCYPGCEAEFSGVEYSADSVVLDGHILTSRGMGTAIPFGLAIVAYLTDRKTADELSKKIVYS